MIELRRMGLINWHLLPSGDIDFRGNVGVIGENRSGKSTLLDMIQVVMTGNSGRYRNLNASANDGRTKRGLRTVHAYCLGRLSPDQVIRPEGALTYIFLVFETLKRAWTLGLALEASPAESEARTLGQFIVPDRALSVADFIDRTDDGAERPRDWALMRPWLENEAGAKVYRDEPGKFVADYLKALSTGQRFINADRFQKAFVNAISFEQIDSATEFVRRYLLDKRDIRIGQLKDSIAIYQRVRKDIAESRDKLTRLEAMQAVIDAYKADLAQHDRGRWIAARALLDWHFNKNRSYKRRHREGLEKLREAQHDRVEYDRLKAAAEEELEGLKGAIREQTQGRRPEYEKDRKLADQAYQAALRELAPLQRALSLGYAAVQIRRHLPAADRAVFDMIERARHAGGQDALPAWPTNPRALAGIFDDPRLDPGAVQDRLRTEIETAIKRRVPLEAKQDDLQRRIADIARKGFSLERSVEDLCDELRRLGFHPRIVGTLLEVTDEAWRHAAEALLGRDREAIIVDDEFVEDAIRHLQRNRQRFRGCRIVNTRKLEVRSAAAHPGTLASVLTSDDPIVMAFVIRRIGNVRLSDTIQELHRPGRAIMRDGTYDDGLIVEMREVVGGHKIGAGAGRAGLAALEREMADLVGVLGDAEASLSDLRRADQALSDFALVAGQGDTLLRACGELQSARERLDQIAADIRAIERNIDPELHARQASLINSIRVYETEARDAVKREAQAKQEIGDVTRILQSGEAEAGSALALRFAWRRSCDLRHLRQIGRRGYREAVQDVKRDYRKLADVARKAADDARDRFLAGKVRIYDLYHDFHIWLGLKTEFARDAAEPVRDLAPWVTQNTQRIRDVDLIRYEDEAIAAADRTKSIFQNSFVFDLRERFDGMRRTIEDMNRTLSGHDFHYERYRFTAKPVELYHDIIRMVEESRNNQAIFDGLFDDEIAVDNSHAAALRKVRALLLDETLDIAEFEDYRRYFVFNMIMKDLKTNREVDLDSRRGTGSGAEQQVPFYVAIGTALAAAYHGRAAGDEAKEKGIGLAVLDEAFAKLDGKNQKACMAYYNKLGLQVIVAAPFEKRTSLYETMDYFIETIRNGDMIDVEPYGIGERTRQAFIEANPANLGLDRFREMAAQPDAA